MTAAIVYYWAALFRGQRWMPPVISTGIIAGLLLGSPPIDESAVAPMLALSFPASMWLAYSTCRVEDRGQENVTIVSLGSVRKAVAARTLASALLAAPVPLAVIVIGASASGLSLSAASVATWHLILIVAVGAGIGSLVGASAQQRPGWAMLVMLLVSLLAVVVPHAPPVRSALETLLAASSSGGAIPLVQAGASVGLAVLTVWLATRLTRHRA